MLGCSPVKARIEREVLVHQNEVPWLVVRAEAEMPAQTSPWSVLESFGFLLDQLISWVVCRPCTRRFEWMGYRYGRNCCYFGRSHSRIWNH
jgi:hypothetical protein